MTATHPHRLVLDHEVDFDLGAHGTVAVDSLLLTVEGSLRTFEGRVGLVVLAPLGELRKFARFLDPFARILAPYADEDDARKARLVLSAPPAVRARMALAANRAGSEATTLARLVRVPEWAGLALALHEYAVESAELA